MILARALPIFFNNEAIPSVKNIKIFMSALKRLNSGKYKTVNPNDVLV